MMNLLTIEDIAKKLEKWADQKIPKLVPGPKLAVTVSLNRLLSGKVDALIKTLRLDGKTEWSKVMKEDYEKLQDAAKRATLDLTKRIVEFKLDKLNKQDNEVSALDILDPDFKMPTDKPWKDSEIPRTVYFDECAQCARQLARTLRQIAEKAELIDEFARKAPVSSKWRRIITCLKKVVEKGWQIFTKSFWESILERMWPK